MLKHIAEANTASRMAARSIAETLTESQSARNWLTPRAFPFWPPFVGGCLRLNSLMVLRSLSVSRALGFSEPNL
jgi:hypothetical protein